VHPVVADAELLVAFAHQAAVGALLPALSFVLPVVADVAVIAADAVHPVVAGAELLVAFAHQVAAGALLPVVSFVLPVVADVELLVAYFVLLVAADVAVEPVLHQAVRFVVLSLLAVQGVDLPVARVLHLADQGACYPVAPVLMVCYY
jgi:hypothetical protein